MRNYLFIYFLTLFSIQFAYTQDKNLEKKNIKLLIDKNNFKGNYLNLEIYNDGPAIIYSFTNEKKDSKKQIFYSLPKKEILIDSNLKVKNIKIKRLLKKAQIGNESFSNKYNLYVIEVLPDRTNQQHKVFLFPNNKNSPIVDFIKLNE